MYTEKQKIRRWDLVDNSIFNLLNELKPADTELKWDINIISKIRTVIENHFVDELKIYKDGEFYPY